VTNTLAYYGTLSVKAINNYYTGPRGLYHKTFAAVINSVMYKASVFVNFKNFIFAFTNTLAFDVKELITAVQKLCHRPQFSITTSIFLKNDKNLQKF